MREGDRRALPDRLLQRCRNEQAATPAWLVQLRGNRDEIAIALGGHALTVEVDMQGVCSLRLGITPSGHVVYPLGSGGEPDVRVAGEAREVASFLLGESPVSARLGDGLVELRSATAHLDRLSRLRNVVARHLRAVAEGAPVVLCRHAYIRARSAAARVRIATFLADKAAPGLFTAATMAVALQPIATSAFSTPAAAHPTQSSAVSARDLGLSRDHPTAMTTPTKGGAPDRARPPDPQVAKGRPGAARAPASPAIVAAQRVNDNDHDATTVDARTPRPNGEGSLQTWSVVHCDSDVRRAVCHGLAALPVAPTPGS